MKKRWGVRVIAILMLTTGLLLFLLGVLPAILAAVRGTGGGLGVWLAIPSALGGCAGALFLLVVGSVLLSLGKIAENFAAVSQPAPDRKAAPAVAVVAATTQPIREEPGPGAATVATMTVAATPEAEAVPTPAVEGPAAEPVAAAVIVEDPRQGAGAVVAEEQPGGEAEIAPVAEPVAAAAIAGAVVTEEQPGGEEEITPAGETAEEAVTPAESRVLGGVAVAMVAAEVLEPPPAEVRSQQDEVSALQAQLAALQAQLDELEGAPPGSEELPAAVDDEGPAPGATESVKLPGADEAARVAAEMAALEMEPQAEAS
jgi:hypothetical protein